jgi:gliding motility-associated-like protein
MEDRDPIKDLFSEKLGQLEAPVRPELWAGVSAQIGASTAAATGGVSFISKVLIGFSIAASVAVTAYLLSENKSESKPADVRGATVPQFEKKELETQSSESVTTSEELSNRKESPTINRQGDQESFSSVMDEKEQPGIVEQQYQGNTFQHTGTNQVVEENKPFSNEEAVENNSIGEPVSGSDKEDRQLQENTSSDLSTDLLIELPNTFTPNGDGINDKFFIQGLNEAGLVDFSLIVLDASNKVVFQTSDSRFEWSGEALNGEQVPAGNYIYYFTAKTNSGKSVTKYSRLTVNRSR